VKHEGSDWTVQLQYVLNNTEYALLTTREHTELVEIVNRTKEAVNGSAGGAFYLNEYGHVVVPSTDADYFFGGTYDEQLEFDFDGETISGRPATGVAPGDVWTGPHVGIPYTLNANASDIRYEATFGSTVERRELSGAVGSDQASRLASRLGGYKPSGGRIYINECREFFAPVEGVDGWCYVYLGPLADDAWFPPPDTGSGAS
jgi:hypothetical protein